jgi:hypothetical protein
MSEIRISEAATFRFLIANYTASIGGKTLTPKLAKHTHAGEDKA